MAETTQVTEAFAGVAMPRKSQIPALMLKLAEQWKPPVGAAVELVMTMGRSITWAVPSHNYVEVAIVFPQYAVLNGAAVHRKVRVFDIPGHPDHYAVLQLYQTAPAQMVQTGEAHYGIDDPEIVPRIFQFLLEQYGHQASTYLPYTAQV
jgi:hypothetical protein